MLNKNKFHAALLNPRCNLSSHSGAWVCTCTYAYTSTCLCLFMYHRSSQPQQLNVECEWVRMKLKNKPKKKKEKLDELQSIGAGSPYWSPSMFRPAVLHQEHTVILPCPHQLTRSWTRSEHFPVFSLRRMHALKKTESGDGACISDTGCVCARVCMCVCAGSVQAQ